MPELPEVETVARQLAPVLTGCSIRRLEVLDSKLAAVSTAKVRNLEIRAVKRIGKRVALLLAMADSEQIERWLCFHLRMTGRLIWYPAAAGKPAAQQHLRLRLHTNGGMLLFVDPRRFGTLDIYSADPVELETGIDPLTPGFTVKRLGQLLAASRQPLKTWLLRQDQLVGLGNIYASEILHAARLHPQRLACSLSAAEVTAVHKATRSILCKAIKYCGTTFSDFQDSRGEMGGFQRFLRVYGRHGQPCLNCQAPVQRIVQGQRSTFYCPQCQPL